MRAPTRRGMLTRPRPLTPVLFTVLGLSCASLCAQTITGTVEAIDHPSYAGIASSFQISNAEADGTLIYDGDLLIFCADLDGTSLDEDIRNYPYQLNAYNSPFELGTLEEFDIWDRYSKTQDEELAISTLHWFVDNYYEDAFLNGDDTSRYAFQNVVWEIFGDAGTANGLSFNNGNIDRSKFSEYGPKSSPELWSEMNAMLDAVKDANVTLDYDPRNRILAINDTRAGYQDYIGLAADPRLMQIPEPSVMSMFGAAGILLLTRRRRTC